MTSDCTMREVLVVLSGYDLGAFGSAEALEERIKALLPISRSMVEKAAGRDFLWHGDEVVEVDGSGSNRLP